jgi:ATP-binding protein involved in chromosome partitioning
MLGERPDLSPGSLPKPRLDKHAGMTETGERRDEMPAPDKDTITQALARVTAPDGRGLVAAGRVAAVAVTGGTVIVSIAIEPSEAKAFEPTRLAAEAAVKALPGVEKAFVALTAERAPGAAPAPTAPKPAGAPPVPGVKRIVAVASGKGGVGKSTTAANLALALRASGLKVGLMDADIYGPSVPKLMGLKGKPELLENRVLKPMEAHGLKVMSIGFMVEDDAPLIWRGPMIDSALTQMLREVAWGDLDVLIVDMPPGTGDAQLTMAQKVPLDGAVIVSTPQDLALIDARKGIAMFRKVDVPVLGLIENMSTFVCPTCGFRCDIFAHGGARKEAERWDAPFLGEIPLHMDIRVTADAGAPIVVAKPDGPHAMAYKEIAARVLAVLDAPPATPAPKRVAFGVG